jgi:hypothetical protein
MVPFNLDRWNKVWLSKPWHLRQVPGTSMIELNGVRGYLVAGDVSFLFNLAAELPVAGRYLEVGSWLGLSSIIVANGLLANLNFQAKIYCVDTWRGSAEHQSLPEIQQDLLYPQFLQNIAESQLGTFIEPIRGASRDVALGWQGPLLDIIFIDGDHSLDGCYQDLWNWSRLLKPNGRLLGHDATPGSDVEQALQRFCQQTGTAVTIYPLPETHYIWEIRRKTDGVI